MIMGPRPPQIKEPPPTPRRSIDSQAFREVSSVIKSPRRVEADTALSVSIPAAADAFIPFYDLGLRFIEVAIGTENLDRIPLRKLRELIDAGKDFDFMVYPQKHHGISGRADRNHLYNKMTRYFDTHLKPIEPPPIHP